jgi:hypothetical protein
MNYSLLAAPLMLLSSLAIAANNTVSEAESAQGWKLLFDGQSTNGWRTYQSDTASAGWQAVDGSLTRVDKAGDLITESTYSNFELQLDWQVGTGGNSGVFIRAGETTPYIFMTAPEIQILDDEVHRDGKSTLTSAGSNYALHPAPRGIVKPAGQWNHMRVLVDGNQVTQWLNGTKVVAYELGSADWQAKVAASKFSAWPTYGTLTEGHIGLQDHGDHVAFRNIKLRRLNMSKQEHE